MDAETQALQDMLNIVGKFERPEIFRMLDYLRARVIAGHYRSELEARRAIAESEPEERKSKCTE